MARNLSVLVAVLCAGLFAGSSHAKLGWTLAQSIEMYGQYKSTTYRGLPGYLPGTVYGFIDKAAVLNHPELDFVVESFLDGKVGMIVYGNSDETRLKADAVQAALVLNGPEASWYGQGEYFLGEVSGEIKYMARLDPDGSSLSIETRENFEAMRRAVNDAKTTAPTAPDTAAAPTSASPVPTDVVSTITSNRWIGDDLIVTGKLTNKSTVPVMIKGIDAKGFDKDQKMVTEGSDFTIFVKDLYPGDVVNFKVELKDTAKQVKFVKVLPSWSP